MRSRQTCSWPSVVQMRGTRSLIAHRKCFVGAQQRCRERTEAKAVELHQLGQQAIGRIGQGEQATATGTHQAAQTTHALEPVRTLQVSNSGSGRPGGTLETEHFLLRGQTPGRRIRGPAAGLIVKIEAEGRTRGRTLPNVFLTISYGHDARLRRVGG